MKATKWSLDPTHSEIGFKIKHLMISNVTGHFGKFDVQAETPGDDFLQSKINATISVDSINTKNEQRDHHLLNADFFQADTYPNISFVSTSIEPADDGFTLHGELTLKDVTRPVSFSVEHSGITKDPWGNVRAGFSLTGRINRKDWGISFNALTETGGLVLGEELKVFAEIQLVRVTVEEPVAVA